MDINTLLIALGVPVSLLVGWLLKNKTDVNNKFIPWINFVIQILAQVAAQIKPANASIFSGTLAHSLGSIIAQAGLITLLSVGSHSTAKNTWQYFRDRALEAAKAKAEAALEKQAGDGPAPTS